MEPFFLALLMVVVSMVSSAALIPVEVAALTAAAATPTDCGIPETVTTTLTVNIPSFITIASPDWASISSSLSWVASIDSVQISDQSDLQPLSETPRPTTPTFVHSILAPGFTASEVSVGPSSIYFVSVGENTTNWSYTPSSPMPVTIGLTTVFVTPIQPTEAAPVVTVNATLSTLKSTRYLTRTTLVTVTAVSHPGWGGYGSGWNATYFTNSTSMAGTGTGSTGVQTITDIVPASTTTVNVTIYPSYNSTWSTPLTTESTAEATSDDTFGRRQVSVSSPSGVCTLIYASIGGHLASWCNNWDGSSPVQSAPTYTTTVIPFPPPGETTTGPGPAKTTVEVTASILTLTNTVLSASSGMPPSSITPTGTFAPTSSTVSAPSSATSCGQNGNFEINFDDLPAYSPPDNNTAPIPMIMNPYQHFFWGNGWGYAPPPNEPFPPQAGDHLGEFTPGKEFNDTGSPDAGIVPDSSFGAGPRASDNNFWFNAESAFIGCDNGASNLSVICDFVATGYQWDPVLQKETVVVTEHFPQPPCVNFTNCQLQPIYFGSQFTALTSLSFYANVMGQLRIYWIDTIELSWWNSTCEAGLNRIRQE